MNNTKYTTLKDAESMFAAPQGGTAGQPAGGSLQADGERVPPHSNKGGTLHSPLTPTQEGSSFPASIFSQFPFEDVERWAGETGARVEYSFDWLNVVVPHPYAHLNPLTSPFDPEPRLRVHSGKLRNMLDWQRRKFYRDWQAQEADAHWLDGLSDAEFEKLVKDYHASVRQAHYFVDPTTDIEKRRDYDFTHAEITDWLPMGLGLLDVKTTSFQGMNRAFCLYPAGRVSYHSRRPENGIVFSFSGSDLARLRSANLDIKQIILHFLSVGAHLTRLDCAIDVFNVGSVSDVVSALRVRDDYLQLPRHEREDIDLPKRGAIALGQKWVHTLSSHMTSGVRRSAETVYLGSKSSERFVRIYDKYEETLEKRNAVQSRIDADGLKAEKLLKQAGKQISTEAIQAEVLKLRQGEFYDLPELPECSSWIRIELSLKKQYAHNTGLALVNHGVGQVISQAVSDYIQIPSLWWFVLALACPRPLVAIEKVRKTITNTEYWLLKQVLPSIYKLVLLGSSLPMNLARDLHDFLYMPQVSPVPS